MLKYAGYGFLRSCVVCWSATSFFDYAAADDINQDIAYQQEVPGKILRITGLPKLM